MPIKRKKLTQRQIKQNKEIKKELQDKGILPPDKQRLNRKKFAKEVCKEWEEENGNSEIFYLLNVLAIMTNSGKYGKVSQEDLGILKLKKCTLVLKKAMNKEKSLTCGEVYELLEPILKL